MGAHGVEVRALNHACGICGKNPAAGWAAIGDQRYCHGDDDPDPTCYMRANWNPAGLDVAWRVVGVRPDGDSLADEESGIRLVMGEDPTEMVPSDGLCRPETT